MNVINRDHAGKIFFAIGVVICLYMFMSPASWSILHVDEYWTYSLVNLPIKEAMVVIVNDVHPPLHYFLLYLFNPLGLTNSLYFVKVFSVIPYILIMIVSATKISEEYGWFTAGLFIFCLGVMTDFFVEFLTARMYSWGLFFLVMTFIYFNEVLTHWDRKSWILLTLFTLLCAYTQYFFGITCALMYLLILIEILRKNRDKLRQFGKSILAVIILYAPWAVVFICQLSVKSSAPHEGFSLADAVTYLLGFAIRSEGFRPETVVYKIIALVFLILILALIYRMRDKFAASGVFLMYATIAIGVCGLMFSFENTMRIRYLVPVFGIFWLSASIVIGKIQNSKILVVALVLVMILAAASVTLTMEHTDECLKFDKEKSDFLSSINNNRSVIAYNTDYGYRVLHMDLNNSKQYTLSDTYFYSDDVEICKDLDQILNKSKGKNVYLVNWKAAEKNKKYEDNYELDNVYDGIHYTFNMVKY